MLQPRICLLGLLPFRPIIRIGCRPTPAECGLDRPAARARQIAGLRMTRLHGSAVLGSVRLSLERGDLEPGPVGAPGTSTACLVVSSPRRLPWASKDARTSPTSSSLRGPLRVISGCAGPAAAWQVNLNKRTPRTRARSPGDPSPAGRMTTCETCSVDLSDPLHVEQPTADRAVSAE